MARSEVAPLTAGLAAMLLGLFAVPLLLLWAGHHLRRKPRWVHRIFWGGLAGHTIAALVALWFSMIPPEAWSPSDTLRGLGGFYSMLIGGVAGAIAAHAGLFISRKRREDWL